MRQSLFFIMTGKKTEIISDSFVMVIKYTVSCLVDNVLFLFLVLPFAHLDIYKSCHHLLR